MATAANIYESAMALMDEMQNGGGESTAGNADYIRRTPAIINLLMGELMHAAGSAEPFIRIEKLSDIVSGTDENYIQTALPYGLAALLLLDENSAAAGFFHERYEEILRAISRKSAALVTEIKNLYAGDLCTEQSRWNSGRY
ncbi:MAG: hypothetical protein GX684_02180 [Ruminococcaceae bacterium]|nr:hypothetical protein [Oscillospiraceae bacterium]